MSSKLSYHRNAERPAVKMWLVDDDGTLLDFSSGYSFVLKIGFPGSTAVLTKSSGITGGAGVGIEPTGTQNVTIAWTGGELDITPGLYSWVLTATNSALDRTFEGTIQILDVIS